MSREAAESGLLPAARILLGAHPASDEVLDALGCRGVGIDHLRYKPGFSTIGRVGGPGGGRWIAGFGPEAQVKTAKLRRKARARGFELLEAAVPDAPGHVLMYGPVGLDNRLRAGLRAARLLRADGSPNGTVLNYNPWRRLVIELPRTADGRRSVSKTTIHPLHGLPAVLAELRTKGVPVLVPRPGRDARTLVYAHYGYGDLAGAWGAAEPSSAAGQAAAAGRILAGLHGSGACPTGRIDPARSLRAVTRGVAHVLPGAASLARATATGLLGAVESLDADDVPLHGDFSADQLLDGSDGLRLIDLDRMAMGPAGWDAGSFAAVELLAGRGDACAAALADAYARQRGGVSNLAAWTGVHVMMRALEPFRAARPGWEETVLERLELAERIARGGGPRAWRTSAQPASAQPVLPGRVEVAGCVVEVQRAWPKADGTQTFEGTDAEGRVRAGRWRGGAAKLLPHAADPALPALTSRGTLVVHRYGRRAVVRVDGPGGTGYLKVLRAGKEAAVAGVSRRLGQKAAVAGLRAPGVVAAGEGCVEFTAVPGMPLTALNTHQWNRAWDAWAEAWPRLVLSEAGGLPAHGVGDERSVLATWTGHLVDHDPLRLSPTSRRTFEERAARASAALGVRAPRREVVAHRDLHDKQLLFDEATGRLGLLDFDTAARADVELDLGNLLAHLDLRRDQGVVTEAARDAAVMRVLGTAEVLGADPRLLDAYTESARIRLVCVYAFRPAWRGLAAHWLDR